MRDALGLAGVVVALLVGIATLIGLVIKTWLLPYLEQHLIEPIQETRKQVTENNHANQRPTVPDLIHDVSKQVAENTRETRAMARMFDGHLDQAQRAEDRIRREIERLWAAIHHRPQEEKGTPE